MRLLALLITHIVQVEVIGRMLSSRNLKRQESRIIYCLTVRKWYFKDLCLLKHLL